MGFFNFFKKAPEIEDSFFGKLKFMENKKNPENSYFEGEGDFAPANRSIEYFITADINGPSKQQRDFYNKLQATYGDIIIEIAPLIEEEFRNWKEDFHIKNFSDEFIPVALSIPQLNQEPLEWYLSFETTHDENHMITVYFENSKASHVVFDG